MSSCAAVQKDPDKRFATAAEARDAFERLLKGEVRTLNKMWWPT